MANLADIRPHKVKDLTGMVFGRLTAKLIAGRDKQGRFVWHCECDCGGKKDVASRHLVQGKIFSCGCLKRERSAKNGKIGAHKISGESSHLYKANLTDKDREDRRNLVALRKWRKSVFERDNYTCGICNAKGNSMNAHHIDCWADYPDRRFDISNGVTLCKPCHKSFHDSMGGPRKSCSQSDFKQYIEREIKKRAR